MQGIYEKAQKLVEDFNHLLESTGKTDKTEKGFLSLGLIPIVGSCYLSEIVIEFQKEYPNIDVSISEKGANSIQQDVFLGTLDIGCVITPIYSNQFEIIPIIKDRNMVLVNENHPLAQKERVSVSDLIDENMVIFSEEFTLNQQIMAACKEMGFKPNVAATSTQWDFLTELVAHNYGVSVLPRPILEKYPHPNSVAIELEENESLREWNPALIYRKNRYMSNTAKLFISFLKQKLKVK